MAGKVFCPANPAKRVEDAKGYTALFGHFMEGEEAFLTEGVALFRHHSYTGEDVVGSSCHGGSAVARRLVEAAHHSRAAPRRPLVRHPPRLPQRQAGADPGRGRYGPDLCRWQTGCGAGQCLPNGALAKKIGAEKDALTLPAGPSDCLGGFP